MFTHQVQPRRNQHFGQIKRSRKTNTHPSPSQKPSFRSQNVRPLTLNKSLLIKDLPSFHRPAACHLFRKNCLEKQLF